MRQRVLLVASKTGYQVAEFQRAAEQLGIDLVLATDRCHVLDNPWGDHAIALPFDGAGLRPADIDALRIRGPFDGVLAVGDRPAFVAACCAEGLGLRFHPSGAVNASNDKRRTRERFRAAGLNAPDFRMADSGNGAQRYPCVLKPLHSSASRGVIRADTPEEFAAALARIRKMTREPGGEENVLVEDFIPGREFALEGIASAGKLRTLAIFDKPDPLDGPFFEETIYVTPSREPASVQHAIREAAQHAVSALGLEYGPVHAEMRVNDRGVWMLEAAARPIGGLCSRLLRFYVAPALLPAASALLPTLVSTTGESVETSLDAAGASAAGTSARATACEAFGLEALLLRHALGQDVSGAALAPGAHGVMMIPIPAAGVYSGVEGLQQARETSDIESVEITAKEGQHLEPLPEGASYLGFLFARASDRERVEKALRGAHACLRFNIASALSVIR